MTGVEQTKVLARAIPDLFIDWKASHSAEDLLNCRFLAVGGRTQFTYENRRVTALKERIKALCAE